MRVVITGGCGFIGTNLTLHFMATEPNTEVVLVDIVPPCIEVSDKVSYVYADIRNLASLLRAFEGADEVYNLAGILGTSELLPISSLACEVNVVGANNVLDAARICGVKRVYNVAKPHFAGLHENAYTLTKNAGELLGLMYREKYGMEVATVRWLNAVGPYQHLYPVRKFVPMMVLLALYDFDLEVYGSGSQTIDPIDVHDLSRFTIHACRHLGKQDKVVDLGSGVAITCNDAAHTILKIVRGYADTKSKVVHLPMRPGEAEGVNLVADMGYWNSVGMKTEVSFEDSVRATVEYIMALPEYHRRNALAFYGKQVEGVLS